MNIVYPQGLNEGEANALAGEFLGCRWLNPSSLSSGVRKPTPNYERETVNRAPLTLNWVNNMTFELLVKGNLALLEIETRACYN